MNDSNKALDNQVGGSHYTDMAIQPVEYILENGIGFAEGTAIAYLSRWQAKGGIEDLRKARHTIELLIEHEERREQERDDEELARTLFFFDPITGNFSQVPPC